LRIPRRKSEADIERRRRELIVKNTLVYKFHGPKDDDDNGTVIDPAVSRRPILRSLSLTSSDRFRQARYRERSKCSVI
jgi:hypothetical protein